MLRHGKWRLILEKSVGHWILSIVLLFYYLSLYLSLSLSHSLSLSLSLSHIDTQTLSLSTFASQHSITCFSKHSICLSFGEKFMLKSSPISPIPTHAGSLTRSSRTASSHFFFLSLSLSLFISYTHTHFLTIYHSLSLSLYPPLPLNTHLLAFRNTPSAYLWARSSCWNQVRFLLFQYMQGRWPDLPGPRAVGRWNCSRCVGGCLWEKHRMV